METGRREDALIDKRDIQLIAKKKRNKKKQHEQETPQGEWKHWKVKEDSVSFLIAGNFFRENDPLKAEPSDNPWRN